MLSNTFGDAISVSFGRIIMVIDHELQCRSMSFGHCSEFLFEIAWLA